MRPPAASDSVMIRIGTVVVAAVFLSACGGTGALHPSRRLSTPPPAATVVTSAGVHRLTTGSYCWSVRSGGSWVTGCGDSAGPAAIPDLPVLHVGRGESLVVRLRFAPTAPVEATIGHARYRLPAASVLHLLVRRGGFLILDPRHGGDDVEYMARVVIAS
jgi:hypothetical protein